MSRSTTCISSLKIAFSARPKAYQWALRHLSHLVHGKLEQIALSSHRFISPYKRYVDDIYLQTTNEEKANEFHDTMNGLHPRLKFEIEKPTASPEGLSLSLLDFKVTITTNGESSFGNQRKSRSSYITSLPYQSAQRPISSERTEAHTTEMFNPNNIQQIRPRLTTFYASRIPRT